MTIDYRIVQQAGLTNPLAGLTGALDRIRQTGIDDTNLAQDAAVHAEKLAKMKMDNMTERDKSRLESSLYGAAQLDAHLSAGDTEGARRFLQQRKSVLEQRMKMGDSVDTQETDEALQMLDTDPEKLKAVTGRAVELGRLTGIFSKAAAPNGGATGQLVDRYMQATGTDFASALHAVQTGLRQGLVLQDGVVTPMQGVPAAKGELAYGEKSGAERAQLDYTAPIEAAKKKGAGEITDLEKSQMGRKALTGTADTLEGLYDQLNAVGGAVSTGKSTLENLGARLRGSAAGQMVGRAVGSEEQSIRNQIGMQIPNLINDIRAATGMSAKAMDSNAELQFYLKMATDPNADIEANKAGLAVLRQKYLIDSKPEGISLEELHAPAKKGRLDPPPLETNAPAASHRWNPQTRALEALQ